MKKYLIIALTLVLTAMLFTGCRRRNDMDNTVVPTPTVTHATTAPTTAPTTAATTAPTTETTAPHPTGEVPEHTPDNTTGTDHDVTEGTDVEGRARRHIPGAR